jgi:hypothetical protein
MPREQALDLLTGALAGGDPTPGDPAGEDAVQAARQV